jgi:acyl carrier protein
MRQPLIDRHTILLALSEITCKPVLGSIDDEENLLESDVIDSAQFLDLVSILEENAGKEIDFLETDAATIVSIGGLIRAFSRE